MIKFDYLSLKITQMPVQWAPNNGPCFMHLPLYVENRDVFEAEKLISNYGLEASLEAAERAEKSRNLGNHISFARWRQIERLIILLSGDKTVGTLH